MGTKHFYWRYRDLCSEMCLGPRGPSFLNVGWWVGILVERSLLVNEPAVTCPQDQVQKAKNLKKDTRTVSMISEDKQRSLLSLKRPDCVKLHEIHFFS